MSSMHLNQHPELDSDRVSLDLLGTQPAGGYGAVEWTPAADIREDEKNIFIDVELPGLTRQEILVEVDNGLLLIKGEHKSDERREPGAYVWRERSYGSFARSFGLPSHVRTDEIKTDYRDGILHLTLLKHEDHCA